MISLSTANKFKYLRKIVYNHLIIEAINLKITLGAERDFKISCGHLFPRSFFKS